MQYDEQHREIYDPKEKSKVDSTGYQPLETRIKQMQQAGIILQMAKHRSQYDSFEENPPDNLRPIPLAGVNPDLADFAELQRENAERVDALNERRRDARAKAKKWNQQQAEAKPEETEAKAPKEKKSAQKEHKLGEQSVT